MSNAAARNAAGRRFPRLHVIVDTVAHAEAALRGGAPAIQVRLKTGTDRERYAATAAIADRCAAADALCVVDDRVDLALAAGAGGVHVGADDLPVDAVRRIGGPGLIVGATARDPEAARARVADGADYLGVGPAYATTSKTGLPDPLGPSRVGEVARAAAVPVLAIAGITAARVPELLAEGVAGVAVIGAVTRAADPPGAVRDLLAVIGAAPLAGQGER
ncbi:MAG TPA: thiamine phosphate synthase [Streptosporangiaceae bacterium]|jgi:thiamine-phosphate pyrophosphorylase